LHGLAPRSADATHKPPETETHAMIAHHWSTTHGELPERTLVPPTLECTQETPDRSLLANCNQEICCGDQVTSVCSLETVDLFTLRAPSGVSWKRTSMLVHGPNSIVLKLNFCYRHNYAVDHVLLVGRDKTG
jgi:hypothetical protein